MPPLQSISLPFHWNTQGFNHNFRVKIRGIIIINLDDVLSLRSCGPGIKWGYDVNKTNWANSVSREKNNDDDGDGKGVIEGVKRRWENKPMNGWTHCRCSGCWFFILSRVFHLCSVKVVVVSFHYYQFSHPRDILLRTQRKRVVCSSRSETEGQINRNERRLTHSWLRRPR